MWVKMRLYTENQLLRLPGNALKVPVMGGFGGCLPTHYQVKLQLTLRLRWAGTKVVIYKNSSQIGVFSIPFTRIDPKSTYIDFFLTS
jgi:hypothetical protein